MQTKTYNPRKEKAEIVIANWYNALKQIKDRNGRVGRMSEFIRARNESPIEDNIWQYGAYTSIGIDYAPKERILLLRDNSELLQLDNAQKAVNAHRDGEEYFITKEKYKQHLKQAEKEVKEVPEKRSIFILPERKNFSINSQTHFDVLRFLAEDPEQAEKYLGRLSEKDINKITFYLRDKDYINRQETPFQDQLWLHGLVDWSRLDGSYRDLGDDLGAFGVFKKTAEGSRPKKIARSSQKLSYSAKEAGKIYNIVEQIRKGNIKLSDLESRLSQVSSFLEALSK